VANCSDLDYPEDKLEVLIGSDGSSDRTAAIARTSTHCNIAVTEFSERRGKPAVLNDLVAMANGEILVFSDANTMYEPHAIRRLVRHFADPLVGGVCGHLALLPRRAGAAAHEGLYWRYENWLKSLESRAGSVVGANGAIYAIRRSGYQPLPLARLVPDDFLIPIRVLEQGYRFIYEPDAVATELTSTTAKGEFLRKARIGASDFNVLPELLPLLNPRSGLIAFMLLSHKVIRWLVPILALVALATNLWLLRWPLMRLALAIQVCFYLVAAIGFVSERVGLNVGLLTVPCYLVSANTALLSGLWRSLSGSQPATWQRGRD